MAPAPSPSCPAPGLDRSWQWGGHKREMGVRGRASDNRGVFEGATERLLERGKEKKTG